MREWEYIVVYLLVLVLVVLLFFALGQLAAQALTEPESMNDMLRRKFQDMQPRRYLPAPIRPYYLQEGHA